MEQADPEARPENGPSSEACSAWPGWGVPGESGRILYLCEDLSVASEEVLPLLREAGYRVQAVPIAQFTLQSWPRARWGLVLVDFAHPDGACFRICSGLRQITGTPIMAVLCGPANRDVLRIYKAGADAFVERSASRREFLARIGALLRRQPQGCRAH